MAIWATEATWPISSHRNIYILSKWTPIYIRILMHICFVCLIQSNQFQFPAKFIFLFMCCCLLQTKMNNLYFSYLLEVSYLLVDEPLQDLPCQYFPVYTGLVQELILCIELYYQNLLNKYSTCIAAEYFVFNFFNFN